MDSHRHHRRSGGIRRDAHAHMHEKRDVLTEVDTVYFTASSDGQGKVIGFTTLGDSESDTPATSTTATQARTTSAVRTTARTTSARTTATPSPTQTPDASTQTTSSSSSSTTQSTTQSTASETSSVDSTTVSTSQFTSTPTTFSTQVSSSSSSFTTDSTSASTSASASLSKFLSPSATLDSQTTSTSSAAPASSGMSTTVTVGVVAGAAAILLVLGAFAAFFYRRKAQKKIAAAYGKTEDEKSNGHGIPYSEKTDDAPSATSEKAPRVSLRPVTQFLPNLTNAAPGTTTSVVAASATQQRVSTSVGGLSRAPSDTRKAPPPALNLANPEPKPAPPIVNILPPAPATPTVVSPTGSTFSDAPSTLASVAAAGSIGPNPVHRVQMDFKPSMGDELELRAGSLVRLLHEYDDGWALCTRLDRSQQGVCPRTCLSQRPVKPRPQGPPPPGSPPQVRPGYPNGRPQSPVIRPYSPANNPRSQSPGPQSRNFPQGHPQSPSMSHPQSPTLARPQSPAIRPKSPGVGYVKAQYRPASPSQSQVQSRPGTPTQSAPQSPITKVLPPPSLMVGPPQITISTAPESRPASPSDSQPQSPVNAGPAFAPVKPSPLSTEQTVEQPASVVNADTEEKKEDQPVFHAM